MARVINTNSPGKRRKAHIRTIAEILRLLAQQKTIDSQSKDMVAAIIFCLRGIDATVEESIVAWEKRGYWKKADDFQQKWWWCQLMANSMEEMVKADAWDQLPETMAKLFPHIADIKINKMTRKSDIWSGSYGKLMRETLK